MSSRAPLCLAYIDHLKEWRSFQTATSMRGIETTSIIFIREPTKAELVSIQAGLAPRGRWIQLSRELPPEFVQHMIDWGQSFHPLSTQLALWGKP